MCRGQKMTNTTFEHRGETYQLTTTGVVCKAAIEPDPFDPVHAFAIRERISTHWPQSGPKPGPKPSIFQKLMEVFRVRTR